MSGMGEGVSILRMCVCVCVCVWDHCHCNFISMACAVCPRSESAEEPGDQGLGSGPNVVLIR